MEPWFRIVRRVVLGDPARDDHELTDLLARLRREATGPLRTRVAPTCASGSCGG